MKKRQRKTIYVLLTRFPDGGSKAISALTCSYYTHASIGFEEDMNTFYSFVNKGFIVEDLSRYANKPGREPFPCQLYEIQVTERIYNAAKKIVSRFEDNKKHMKYTVFGVAMCMFNVKYHKNRSYFCSHFVAEVLKRSKAVNLKKDTSLYFPKDLKKVDGLKLGFTGNLRGMINHFGIVPSLSL